MTFTKKGIVITTIYHISKAIHKYVEKKDWCVYIVGDKKTPELEYFELEKNNENVKYLSVDYQEKHYKVISDLIGWNTIRRRNIGFLEALKNDMQLIATVDDDNIPLDNWGENILVGKEIDINCYNTDDIVFDPICVTNYENIWHRGFPIQLLHKRKDRYTLTRKKIKVDIQADFWNGDPDIDAICRLEHKPDCIFNDMYFPFCSNKFSPFNSQNTFLSREALKKYLVIPFIGRMDDIWISYYIQSLGFNVIYNKATVLQDRNVQDLTKNMKDEFIGYEHNLALINDLILDPNNIYKYIPIESKNVMEEYFKISHKLL